MVACTELASCYIACNDVFVQLSMYPCVSRRDPRRLKSHAFTQQSYSSKVMSSDRQCYCMYFGYYETISVIAVHTPCIVSAPDCDILNYDIAAVKCCYV